MLKNNILIVDKYLSLLINEINYPVGGATVQSFNWVKGFINNGLNPIILSEVKVKNKSRYTILATKKYNAIFKPLLLLIYYYKLTIRFKPKFAYVSVPWWSNIYLFLACRINGVKIIQRISNDIFVDERLNNVITGLIKKTLFKVNYKLTDIFVCQNSYQESHLKKYNNSSKIVKYYNPFEQKQFKHNRNRSYIAWVGIFQKQKNLSELLSIAKKLPMYKFKIAGDKLKSIDKETSDLLKLIENLNNVELVGMIKRDQIFNFLANAYCLLNTSHYEGFSNTYLESFSVNTPVVTRNITDPDNIIKEFNLGISVKNYNDIPNAITNIIENKYEFNNFSKYLDKYHDPVNISKKLILDIEQL